MGQFGELFGAARLRKESQDDDGTGERFDPGPLDLSSGVIPARPRPKNPVADDDAAAEDDN
jgi:hypothetical protein